MLEFIAVSFLVAITQRVCSSDCSAYEQCQGETLSSGGNFFCYGYRSCYSADISAYENIYCVGGAACTNSPTLTTDAAFEVQCKSNFGCAMITSISTGNMIRCNGAFSCINTKSAALEYSGKSWLFIHGTQAFLNVNYKSSNSYSTSLEENTRDIYGTIGGSFATYGSTITSNGNNLNIYLFGYYSGYGLTINCSHYDYDECYIFCHGNACVNLNLLCSDSSITQCATTCADSDDSSCTNYQTTDEIEYDSMVDIVNNLIHQFDSNYSILMTEITDSTFATNYVNQLNDNNNCDLLRAFNYSSGSNTQYQSASIILSLKANENNNICCLAFEACKESTITVFGGDDNDDDDNDDYTLGNVYCNGQWACIGLVLANKSSNIYVGGKSGAVNGNFSFVNMTLCQGWDSCANSSFIGGKLIVCEGSEACKGSRLKNIETIVALGYNSLKESIISYDDSYNYNKTYKIYVLGYDAAKGLTITNSTFNSRLNNVGIYCQNSGCNNIKTQLFCDEENDIGVKQCSVTTESPTESPSKQPTTIPTESPTPIPLASTTALTTTRSTITTTKGIGNNTNSGGTTKMSTTTSVKSGSSNTKKKKGLGNFVKFLDNATATIAFALFCVVVTLMFVSFYLHKLRSKSNQHELEYLMMQTLKNDDIGEQNNSMDIDIKKKEADLIDLQLNLNSSQSLTMQQQQGSKQSYFVNYISGFGKNANHFVIAFIAFEIFDVYTDIAYLFELIYDEYFEMYQIFLGSMVITGVFNVILVLFVLKTEFGRNNVFTNWFYEHNGIILALIALFVLTDINMISTVFTSQIFGHEIFYSPISLVSINIIQISNVFSIVIQHVPQLIVQITVLMKTSQQFNSIVLATLIVSAIDIVFLTIKALVWMVLHFQTTTIRKQSETIASVSARGHSSH